MTIYKKVHVVNISYIYSFKLLSALFTIFFPCKKVASLMASLHCIQSSVHSTDVSYLDFLNRVHVGEEKLRARGLWDIPHPWLNLFVPSDKIVEFDTVVFKKILGKSSAGPIIIYPMNRNK